MRRLTRRRLLTISAALPLAAGLPALASEPSRVWRGFAMGARVELRLAHPDGARLARMALAEIARLEEVFSLYNTDSALMRLNRAGQLDAPAPELLECLALCAAVHAASGGRFDPTVQPLWAALAEAHAAGRAPTGDEIAQARALIGWRGVDFSAQSVRFARPGMALTLNGVAQGVVADRVAMLLRREGLEMGFIDTGEMQAIGPDWPVELKSGGALTLSDRALASSQTLGTVLDADGNQGHILSPLGKEPPTRAVSISARSAGLADALSTAACLMPDEQGITDMVARFGGARVEALS
ncbi:MAG: thiamine biosynthesis lipoprotein [Rhodobacteraceae bacterium HLUCCO07]|nr:MAG: thiamine biosynthesis lipoprotein [Rhodobacteraceae bacterium HLUCCO07]